MTSLQRLRRLSRRRSSRTQEGAFVIDGPVLLGEALDADVAVDVVVAEPGAPPELVRRAAARGAAVREVAPGALKRATDPVTPQPVAAIAPIPERTLTDVLAPAGRPSSALVLVGVGDPGNAGTLLRSAEATGVAAVLFCEGSVDPYGPKCVRSSAGAVFRLGVARETTAEDALSALHATGVGSLAAVARPGVVAYDEVDLSGPVAFVLGNEAHGLPSAVEATVDRIVTIPMAGRAESLNVAMAGTILCFESLRQRRQTGSPSGHSV